MERRIGLRDRIPENRPVMTNEGQQGSGFVRVCPAMSRCLKNGEYSTRHVMIVIGSSAGLLFQNVVEAFIMRLSRQGPGEKYIVTTAVFLMQFFKILVCFSLLIMQGNRVWEIFGHFKSLSAREWLILSVPSFMYTLQNNLRFVALQHMPSSSYQVMSQLKVLTTAIFSVLLLRRKVHRVQWISLLLLVCGVVIVQLQPTAASASSDDDPTSTSMVGTLAVLSIVTLSGAAGAYTEGITKKNLNVSIYYINIQLGLFSLMNNGCYLVATEGREIFTSGVFFRGYNSLVWAVILLGALGGIFVGIVVRYTSSLAKTYIVSSAIFVNTIIDAASGHALISGQFWVAVLVVGCSVLLFNDPVTRQPQSGQKKSPKSPLPVRDAELGSIKPTSRV